MVWAQRSTYWKKASLSAYHYKSLARAAGLKKRAEERKRFNEMKEGANNRVEERQRTGKGWPSIAKIRMDLKSSPENGTERKRIIEAGLKVQKKVAASLMDSIGTLASAERTEPVVVKKGRSTIYTR